MASLQQIKTLVPVMALLGLVLLVASFPTGTLAQGPTLPTPTNVGEGSGGGGGGGSPSTPAPLKARVSGFVYDYSNGVYQGGVAVVIDGGGWASRGSH